MEYTGALGTIIFDKSCCLRNLTEAQVGQNQFAMDVAVDRLDREVDHALERLSALEGKVIDLEAGYTELLALGREQVETTTCSARALGQLAMVVLAQQGKIWIMEERMDAMREMILALEHMQENPIVVDEEETAVSDGLGEELEIEENEVAIPIPACQDMIFLNFYFDQFHAHLMNNYPSPHRHFQYDLMTFTIS